MEWRDITICEGYEVSDKGCVRRKGAERHHTQFTVRGRPYVSIRHNLYQVHRLVAWAFLGPKPSSKAQVCHIDGDRWNNTPDNLYWGDSVTNGRDKVRLGESRGSNNGRARLSDADVLEIVRLKGELSDRLTAERFGVGTATISHIRTGKNWSHVTGIQKERAEALSP